MVPMSTHDEARFTGLTPATGTTAVAAGAPPAPAVSGEADAPWWHRSHPVFTPLAAFFTGLVVVVVELGLFGAILGKLAGRENVLQLLPLGLVTLVVPLALLIRPGTRRFGVFMLTGMIATGVVIGGSGALTLWFLLQ
jgi:hypothetical protein